LQSVFTLLSQIDEENIVPLIFDPVRLYETANKWQEERRKEEENKLEIPQR